jgi:hypothetical protein
LFAPTPIAWFRSGEEERVPRVVKTVGDRPTNSSKKPKPPFGGTNPDAEKTQGKLKDNQKQKYWPIGQNFKQTKKQQTPP